MTPERGEEERAPKGSLPESDLHAELDRIVEQSETGKGFLARGYKWVRDTNTGRGKWVWRGAAGVAVISGIFLAGREIRHQIQKHNNEDKPTE